MACPDDLQRLHEGRLAGLEASMSAQADIQRTIMDLLVSIQGDIIGLKTADARWDNGLSNEIAKKVDARARVSNRRMTLAISLVGVAIVAVQTLSNLGVWP